MLSLTYGKICKYGFYIGIAYILFDLILYFNHTDYMHSCMWNEYNIIKIYNDLIKSSKNIPPFDNCSFAIYSSAL